MCNKDDMVTLVAGRIAKLVKNIGTEPCKLCEGFTDYRGKCIGFSWDMTYFPPTAMDNHNDIKGIWHFSIYHHTKEIYYVAKEGTVMDLMFTVYEKLASGEWRQDAKETWRKKGERIG